MDVSDDVQEEDCLVTESMQESEVKDEIGSYHSGFIVHLFYA